MVNELTKRQEVIIRCIEQGKTANRELLQVLKKEFASTSRMTIYRELRSLVSAGMLIRDGRGRNTRYRLVRTSPWLQYIDVARYFQKPPDERMVLICNPQKFAEHGSLFTQQEFTGLQRWTASYQFNRASLSPSLQQREIERFTIELSWKSSRIEGNTYSLLQTEALLKDHEEADGHALAEAQMLLNHKHAIDFLFKHSADFRQLNRALIEHVHQLIAVDLGINLGLRSKPVGITGTRYRPPDNLHQVRDALTEAIRVINAAGDPWTKSLLCLLLLSLIQPFDDGNKRTARMISNGLLLAADCCPLSYRSVSESAYKEAIVLFYETQSATFMKNIFLQQMEFATKNYFLA